VAEGRSGSDWGSDLWRHGCKWFYIRALGSFLDATYLEIEVRGLSMRPLGIVVLALACMRVHQAAQEGEVTVGFSRWHCDCEVAKCSAFCAHFRTLVLS
jgi:hypothetical protein